MSKKKTEETEVVTLEHQLRLMRKIKLNGNGGLTLEWKDTFYDEKENRHVHVDGSKTSDLVAHPDLIVALETLREHLMLCCEFVTKLPKAQPRPNFDGSLPDTKKFKVGSVTLRGGEDDKPVQVFIYGRKTLKSGHACNFGTYGIKLDHAQESYEFAAELHQHIEVLEDEVVQYMNGKAAKPAQTSLNLNGEEGEEGAESTGAEEEANEEQ